MLSRLRLLTLCFLLPGLAASAAGAATVRVLDGLDRPAFVTAPDGDARLFIVTLPGEILVYGGGALLPTPFLDITGRVDTGDSEGGLLGLAFDPDYAATRAFYVYYTVAGSGGDALTSRISRFRASVADPDVADPAEKVLLEWGQPRANHNGGTVAFGADGMLYMAFGDGGGQHDPNELAQDPMDLLGKLIRLDVSFTSFDDDYAIPPDNPFVGVAGVREEIFALGFRNPFRFSFDRQGGDLYIGDVGQDTFEEIDVQPATSPGGENYGWDVMEGTDCHEAPDPGEPPCNDPSLTLPVHEYAQAATGGCSVTGGVVYRGSRVDLQGQYLFGDFCTAEFWSFEWDGADGIVPGSLVDRTAEFAPDVGSLERPVAFGEDGAGEVYIVELNVSPSAGEIFRIEAPEPEAAALALTGGAVLALAGLRRSRRG